MSRDYKLHYNKEFYPNGTKFLYKGNGIYNNVETSLDNVEIVWLYYERPYCYFQYGNNVFKCMYQEFKNGIVCVSPSNITKTHKKTKEIIWTDGMVTATIWYIIIMAIATIFYARIPIWIIATLMWCGYMKKNKIEIWR